ncbi:uncharacterized protein JN550_007012 [Neoarthrinium moseri]|uniref:uncharacterized protein n=1 Tax=Neoarthrinium moseri TaxID=1658444 RepID=UPI001FDC0DE8|nr:uncharacterized protein JN550_007012 [Neoarthrinium moseri]KAI1867281.1 hypothetical protein JN550_007012 [Neoarthrinium moseri]
MNFEYVKEPQGKFEEAVIEAGYPWVRTNTIEKTRMADFDPSYIDRLNAHSHSGTNTHLIVDGDLRFNVKRAQGGDLDSREACDSGDICYQHEFYVLEKASYSATTTTGATFVEGHRCLSPTTAERFMGRGTLTARPVAEVDTKQLPARTAPAKSSSKTASSSVGSWPRNLQWPGDDKIMAWLRGVVFLPGPPTSIAWESPVATEDDMAARRCIERWFAKEWRHASRRITHPVNCGELHGYINDSNLEGSVGDDEDDQDDEILLG